MSTTYEAKVSASVTRASECTTACRRAPWIRYYRDGELVRTGQPHHQRGDVRHCEHDRIWYCEGRYTATSYSLSGFWTRLSPIWNPIMYWRAARALGDAEL